MSATAMNPIFSGDGFFSNSVQMLGMNTCSGGCEVDRRDAQAAEDAARMGNMALAESIRAESAERRNRCLGQVSVATGYECGMLHGNLRMAELPVNIQSPAKPLAQ